MRGLLGRTVNTLKARVHLPRRRTQPVVLTPLIWQRSDRQLRRRLSHLLVDSEAAKLLDADYMKSVSARRQERAAIINKVILFSGTLTIFMGASLFVGDLSFNFLGLGVQRTDQIVEIAVVLNALLGIYACILQLENRQLRVVLEELSVLRAGPKIGELLKFAFSNPGEGINVPVDQNDHFAPTKVSKWFIRCWVGLLFLAIGVIVLASTAVHFAILWRMFDDPSIGPFTSRLLASFAILLYFISYGLMAITWLPFPFRDYTDVMELAPLFESNKEEWWKEMQRRVIEREKSKKPQS